MDRTTNTGTRFVACLTLLRKKTKLKLRRPTMKHASRARIAARKPTGAARGSPLMRQFRPVHGQIPELHAVAAVVLGRVKRSIGAIDES